MSITMEDIQAFREWQTSEEYYNQESAMTTPTVMDMVKEFAKVTGQEPNPELSASLIVEECGEWQEEVNIGYSEWYANFSENLRDFNCNNEEELKELSDLVYVIYGYANVRGWNLEEALKRVHQNNVGRCIQPDGSIKRSETGKILKNKDYPKVQLGDLV